MRGAVACFIFKVFQNLYPEIGSGATLFVHYYNTINTNNMIKNDTITMSDNLKDYRFPPIDLLKDHKCEHSGLSVRELDKNINRLKSVLSDCKIEVADIKAFVGPAVTLYQVIVASGVRISKIRRYQDDIEWAMSSKSIRIVPLPGSLGIEVANERPVKVSLKSMLDDDAFRKSNAVLPVAIGYTTMQEVKVFDLAEAPHLLVAGATGQGKSVCLDVIVTSLLYAKLPSELKFVFIDPKKSEFSPFSKLDFHYLAMLPDTASVKDAKSDAVVKDSVTAEKVLRSLCMEMEQRCELLSETGVNNIGHYNEKHKGHRSDSDDDCGSLPYIVVMIDEYADLIMNDFDRNSKDSAKSIYSSIIKLAQKGKAVGIHLVISTQRPSRDLITGLIKANFPTRLAFRVSTKEDSLTIIDAPGAEKLIGNGDMLYCSGTDMERLQCAMIDEEEINAVTKFIGEQAG